MYIRREFSSVESMNISCIIITYNEEKNIERCIKALQEVADEILVVDSFSTDKTKEICLKYNTRFVENKFEGYNEQKNFAVELATYKYILSVDADEVVSDRLKKSILEVKNNWKADGYYFNRLTNYCGHWIKHGGWYPDQKLRLFDSRKGTFGGINPHDKYIMQEDAKIQYIKGDLLHYSYYTIAEHINQVNKFTETSAKEAIKRGKKSSILKIIFSPIWKFIRDYFLRMGFLDGYYGFIISVISSHTTFIKYIKIYELEQNTKS
jgi:glycosyltransferase involved in cell wall biosynthesis